MSVELSKLQKEGLLVTKRNHFELLTRWDRLRAARRRFYRQILPGGAKTADNRFRVICRKVQNDHSPDRSEISDSISE